MICSLCPRKCNIDRTKSSGYCGESEDIKIAKYSLFMYEEPCISGEKGSGAIFFSGCSLCLLWKPAFPFFKVLPVHLRLLETFLTSLSFPVLFRQLLANLCLSLSWHSSYSTASRGFQIRGDSQLNIRWKPLGVKQHVWFAEPSFASHNVALVAS